MESEFKLDIAETHAIELRVSFRVVRNRHAIQIVMQVILIFCSIFVNYILLILTLVIDHQLSSMNTLLREIAVIIGILRHDRNVA